MNRTNFAIRSDPVATWEFLVESHAERRSEAIDELSNICEDLYEAFDGFVVPLRIQYKLQVLAEDGPIPHPSRDQIAPEVRTVELVDDGGVDVGELLDSFHVDPPASTYVREIPFERTLVKVRLVSGDRYVDRTSGCVAYEKGAPVDRALAHDPLSVRLLHAPFDVDGLDTEFCYCLRVQLRSDIWFDESDSGRRNRTRLVDFFERLEETLPVDRVDRRSERLPQSQLEEVY